MSRFDLFKKMGNNLIGYGVDAMFGATAKDKGGTFIVLLFFLIALGILVALLYAAVEVVYLLVRNKFGTEGVKRLSVFGGAIVFLYLAYFSYGSYKDYYGFVADLGSQISYLYASITFLIISIVVLAKGVSAGGQDDIDVIDPIYRGNSWLLGGLIKGGIRQSTVQDLAEPLLFLAIGFCLLSYNYVWGIPFIFCAFSYWIHLGIEAAFGFMGERKKLSNQGRVYTENRTISKIIS
jgi:hypothetical protein